MQIPCGVEISEKVAILPHLTIHVYIELNPMEFNVFKSHFGNFQV